MNKKEAMLHFAKVMEVPRVASWCAAALENRPRTESVNDLEKGVREGKISFREALALALVIGFQWEEDFEVENQ
jgi:hypothetical protein